MAFQGPTIIYQVLARVRDDLQAAFVSAGTPFTRIGVVPGAIAWDECDQCGLLALALTRLFLSEDFPIEATIGDARAPYVGADLVVQAIRCVPTSAEDGSAPSVDALNRSGATICADAVLVLCTVLDTLDALVASSEIVAYTIRQSSVVGPEGACGGSELAFAVAVTQ